MVAIAYRPADLSDAVVLAPVLRAMDRAEIAAATGVRPEEALVDSLAASSRAIAVTGDGATIALFGVVPSTLACGDGRIWFVGSEAATRCPRLWLSDARDWLTLLGWGFRRLGNHVDARNAGAIRWLRRMGFCVAPAVPFGPRGLLFHPFERVV